MFEIEKIQQIISFVKLEPTNVYQSNLLYKKWNHIISLMAFLDFFF